MRVLVAEFTRLVESLEPGERLSIKKVAAPAASKKKRKRPGAKKSSRKAVKTG